MKTVFTKLRRATLTPISRFLATTGLFLVLYRWLFAILKWLDFEDYYKSNLRLGWILEGPPSLWRIVPEFHFEKPDESDRAGIVPRIIAAYRSNARFASESDNGASISPLWTANLSGRWSELLHALRSADQISCFALLGNMFREKYIWGLAHGDEVDRFPHRRPNKILNVLTSLVELGEALGVARAETPEQGAKCLELMRGPELLLDKVERSLGIDLGFPRIAAAYGIDIGGRLIMLGQLFHVYAAWRLKLHAERTFEPDRKLRIVEIGGGYGGLCHWTLKLLRNRIESYTIVDLPSTNVVQAYFLANSGTDPAVALYDSATRAFDTQAVTRLVPHTALDAAQEADVVINQDSFPELPATEVDRYLKWISAKARFFLSFNQEASRPTDQWDQTWLSERCANVAGMRRVERHLSWVRFGWIEELYSRL